MSIRYRTVRHRGEAQIIIEKSKFIGYIQPAESPEEAEEFIASIRSMHRNANHNVPVYVLGEHFETQKYSDDGEPSGTAGVPVLQMLIKEGITNVVVVMTRYFGGIKLGTGGLVRAYTGIAKEALRAAEVVDVKDMDIIEVEIQYTHHGKIENMAQQGRMTIRSTEFTDKVRMELMCDPSETETVRKELMEVTGGTVCFDQTRQVLEKVKKS